MKFVLLFFLINILTVAFPQEAILLKNPSFEGKPNYGVVPGGWRNCAFNNESPPDLHPVEKGQFQVTRLPKDGESYLGLVVRDVGTTESVGQELSQPFTAGQCYSFELFLCRSEKLISISRVKRKPVNYNQPVSLRLWGGMSPCGQKSLLAVSSPIENIDWVKYTFQFKPEESFNWIALEAYYSEDTQGAYNGNLLLDNASPFIPIDCDTKKLLISPDTIEMPVYKYENHKINDNTPSRIFHSGQSRLDHYLGFRVVENAAGIKGLIKENCQIVGFLFGSSRFVDDLGLGLKEIAINVQRQEGAIILDVGLVHIGAPLTKKRMKQIKRTFREIGLSKKYYRINNLKHKDEQGQTWSCGQNELWIRIYENAKIK